MTSASNEGYLEVREDFTITEKAPTILPNFMSTYPGLTPVKHSVLNVKVLVDAFNQEKALVGTFSVIVESSRTFV